jgi:guanylate kinase
MSSEESNSAAGTRGSSTVKGTLFVVSGPSGAGKSSVCQALLSREPDLVLSVSYTTRAPRGSEQHGGAYFFVDDATFDAMVAEDAFVEWAHVHDHRYGTARTFIDAALSTGRSVLFDIDYQGAALLRAAYADAVTVMLVPPSLDALATRLRGRGTDAPAVIERRLGRASVEMSHAPAFDYVVVNDALPAAIQRISAIFTAAKCRTALVWPAVKDALT